MRTPVLQKLCLCLLLACVAGWTTAQDADHGAAALTRVQAYLDSLHSLRAGFDQALFDAESRPVQESSGTLRLQRPGRFRWDYAPPFEQSIVADGERLWIYDADLEQVTVRTLDKTLASTPAMLLSGDGRVRDGYDFQAGFTAEGIEWIELAPRVTDTDFRLVRLGFEGEALRVMDLVDSLGQTTRIRFREIENNPELDAEVFRFAPPEGADVIGADDL